MLSNIYLNNKFIIFTVTTVKINKIKQNYHFYTNNRNNIQITIQVIVSECVENKATNNLTSNPRR